MEAALDDVLLRRAKGSDDPRARQPTPEDLTSHAFTNDFYCRLKLACRQNEKEKEKEERRRRGRGGDDDEEVLERAVNGIITRNREKKRWRYCALSNKLHLLSTLL